MLNARERVLQGIYRTREDQCFHLRAIRRMQPEADDVFEHNYLYDCLSILDTKVQGLLTYDSILVASTSLVLATIPVAITAGSIVIFIALSLSAISSLLSLFVIWVYWTDTAEFEHSENLFLALLQVRNRRTIAYRLSWLTAHFATVLLVFGILVQRRFS